MDRPNVQAEIIRIESWTGTIGDPPQPYHAVQLTVLEQAGQVRQLPWLAMSEALARELISQLQRNLGPLPPAPPDATKH